jgi:hypothetical protein
LVEDFYKMIEAAQRLDMKITWLNWV